MSNNGHNHLGRVDFTAKRRTVTVDIPELGGSFTLKAVSARELLGLEDGAASDSIKMLAQSIVDENGERIYTTPEDIENLREMPVSVYTPLIQALNELNGATKKAAADTEKKSAASPNTDSVSA